MSIPNDTPIINYDDLNNDIDELSGMAKAVSEANGALRSRLNTILETRGYNKKALAIMRQIDGMSETGRADFLRTFEPMLEAMLECKWRAAMADMLEGLGEEAA